MIDQSEFPASPYHQALGECMPASLGNAIYPFTQKKVEDVIDAYSRCQDQDMIILRVSAATVMSSCLRMLALKSN